MNLYAQWFKAWQITKICFTSFARYFTIDSAVNKQVTVESHLKIYCCWENIDSVHYQKFQFSPSIVSILSKITVKNNVTLNIENVFLF